MPVPVEAIATTCSVLSSILSIAASVKQLSSERELSETDALSYFQDEKASVKEKQVLSDHDLRDAVISLMVIPQQLLDQLHSEAEDCIDTHVRERRRANTKVRRTLADGNAKDCMCSVLRDMMVHNQGKLPRSKEIESWWKAYNCSP